ncbi:hypothetical protein OH77DRAFT_1580407 [Trametes cingulata]|nr:hypothetical protein OH77DRAFT_1580407 [Trametes cingulata]
MGQKIEARGTFLDPHPQSRTHVIRKCTVWVVPVILGNGVPRKDRGDEEREAWARMMLILFVPWRHPRDLKRRGETWYNAYERQQGSITHPCETIIQNMNVLSKCKDAQDELRFAGRAVPATMLNLPVNEQESGDMTAAMHLIDPRGAQAEYFYSDLDEAPPSGRSRRDSPP